MRVAVLQRQIARLPHVGQNPGFVVGRLEICRLLNAGHGAAHALAVVRLERILARHLQRVHLVEMQMPIDKGFRNEATLGIDHLPGLGRQTLLQGDDFAIPDGNVQQFGAFARLGVPDQNVADHVYPPCVDICRP